jgi:uncharacterized membrane protein/thiol-disulfide isomerase/thioredoxin
MKHHCFHGLVTLIFILSSFLIRSAAVAGEPVIHALFFFSPSCPHCHKVISEDLPPIVEKYQENLKILVVNTYTEKGQELYMSAVDRFEIPDQRIGVPTLIVGEHVMVGSLEIPNELPGIIETGLAAGGIGWPEIPGLLELIENEVPEESESELNESGDIVANSMDTEETDTSKSDASKSDASEPDASEPDASPDIFEREESRANWQGLDDTISEVSEDRDFNDIVLSAENMSLSERFMRDLEGNIISVLVLFGLIACVTGSSAKILGSHKKPERHPNWVIPLILLVGLFVAIYMAYVEINQTEAVCGPVGDCNTVQQSEYAYLFGIIPIGLFGVFGYLGIGFVWLFSLRGPTNLHKFSKTILWAFALFGTLFSIYLTMLEPFVIGATCAWCLTSAVVMALLLWVSTPIFMETRSGKKSKRKRGIR